MAILARIVDAAAGHFYGDNVEHGVVMDAPRLRVYINTSNLRLYDGGLT